MLKTNSDQVGKIRANGLDHDGGGGEMQGVTSGMSMEAGEEGLGRGGWDSMASDTWTHSPALE